MTKRRKIGRIGIVVILILHLGTIPTPSSVSAARLLLASEKLFDLVYGVPVTEWGKYGWGGEQELPTCLINSVTVDKSKNLAPPVDSLTVEIRTNTGCSSTAFGRLELVSPSGAVKVPSGQNRIESMCDSECVASETIRTVPPLKCSVLNDCSQRFSFSTFQFPLGTEAGVWSLRLKVFWAELAFDEAKMLLKDQTMSRVIVFPTGLSVAQTLAPAITIVPPSTTSAVILQPSSLAGQKCVSVGKKRTLGGKRFICVRSRGQKVWRVIR